MGTKDDPAVPELALGASAAALADDAAHGLARRLPALSAHRVVTAGQAVVLIAVASAALCGAIGSPGAAWTILTVVTWFAFVAGTLFRAALACLGGAPRADPAMRGADLPVYTVLVPLYREANVLPRLARALLVLDYPGMLAHPPQEKLRVRT